jgi:hypothetical protein
MGEHQTERLDTRRLIIRKSARAIGFDCPATLSARADALNVDNLRKS